MPLAADATYQANFPPPYPPYPYPPQYHKEPWLAVLLSFLIAGLGQIYVGRILRGVLILFSIPLASIATAFIMYELVMGFSYGDSGAFTVFWAAIIIAVVAFYIWQLVDAYALAEKYNRIVAQTGRPPW
jgi:signal peptidase I